MAKRTGLSAEDKRIKLLELFHETGDVFQLKELEQIAPKEKGIVRQAVKTTLQLLVDNGEVCSEKIAGCLFYWSFPNQTLKTLQKQIEEDEKVDFKLQVQIEAFKKQIDIATTAAGDTEANAKLEAEIEILRKERDELKARVDLLPKEVDYDAVKRKQADTEKLLVAANRWTDNIFCTKSWIKRKFNKDDAELNKAFNIPDDLDYLENIKNK